MSHDCKLVIGIDVGSTTCKMAVVDPETKEILWSKYQRHETRQPEMTREMLLEIEAAETGGARVTIGEELAPGLVARFSRQFGTDEYDEATLEYYLSRLFRIRATFSDAGSTIRSPFRRVERAGSDLLVFFSF